MHWRHVLAVVAMTKKAVHKLGSSLGLSIYTPLLLPSELSLIGVLEQGVVEMRPCPKVVSMSTYPHIFARIDES